MIGDPLQAHPILEQEIDGPRGPRRPQRQPSPPYIAQASDGRRTPAALVCPAPLLAPAPGPRPTTADVPRSRTTTTMSTQPELITTVDAPGSHLHRTSSRSSTSDSLEKTDLASGAAAVEVRDPEKADRALVQEEDEPTTLSKFYARYRPFVLAGVAAVILGWWISATVLEATRHRWYVSLSLSVALSVPRPAPDEDEEHRASLGG